MTPTNLWLTPAWLYWAYAWALLLVLVLPLLWYLWLRPKRRPVIRYSELSTLRSAASAWPRRFRLILPLLRTAALLCLIVAVARPQRPDESSRQFAEGIAIQMVVDVSSSMTDEDLSPRGKHLTRLDLVRDVFKRFVNGDGNLPGRPNDLVGMVRFARYADAACPLTLDHDSLIEVLNATTYAGEEFRSEQRTLAAKRSLSFAERDRYRKLDQAARAEDATAIGDGLALAVGRLKDVKRTSGSGEQLAIKSRVAILLTDGENNAGQITPEQAGELAATYGIKVYTILAGTGQNLGNDFSGQAFRKPVDDRVLRGIADVTGGKFYQARDAKSLEKIYVDIDELERTRTEERRYVRWGDLSRPWLLAAFAFLTLQTLLDATRLRKIP